MIEYLIGVDGGGTGTRVRLTCAAGTELAQGASGPSGLAHGIANAWASINDAVNQAFAAIGVSMPAIGNVAIGLGLAGVHNKQWAADFIAADPGFGALVLDTDGFTTLMGAHGGEPGTIVAIGTGSVGEALLPSGDKREVGGWGFPAGDEASGAWMGLKAIGYSQQVLDGRKPDGAFARAVIDACGGNRDAIQLWLGKATQTSYASLARFVLAHGDTDPVARAILLEAGQEVANIAAALDPSGLLPLALCGGLGERLSHYLPAALLARTVPPKGDSAAGALRMIQLHLKKAHQ
ncbi:BadF/BadG/BcrA/BcrD ATPase family protein [Massilia horti]|uniref:ATPase n=1 Tax=Massilia horti TaxID=2562153 RepID=A0A4Y9SSA1_9BURK|nr:BadF/BadG/BcrA/BcrD ATPase family protein [Massilia horti]TFW29580.1 ATPase [Massilia horti]